MQILKLQLARKFSTEMEAKANKPDKGTSWALWVKRIVSKTQPEK
jgi:hypothetical protein